MTETSPRLELPYLMPSQAQKHVTVNESLQRLDALVQLTLTTIEAVTPPLSPANGEMHAVGANPTGAWDGQSGLVALWDGTGWQFILPAKGWIAYDIVSQDIVKFEENGWQKLVPQMENLEGIGVGTSYDANNRLSVTSPATLLSHQGSDHQLKINKAAAGNTASLLLQSDWVGHAEIGLAGDTSLSFKISAEGSNWIDVMRMNPSAGSITWAPAGDTRATLSDNTFKLDVPITGSAVQSDPLDTTPGRIMAVGSFGLGAFESAAIGVNDGNAVLPTGFFAGTGEESTNFPAGGAVDFPILSLNAGTNSDSWSSVRVFFQSNATPVLRTSGDNGATWSDDVTLYGSANLLAPVSQSNGTPSGGVIERGTGVEGDYVRFADGTQICTLSRNTTVTTFPNGALHIDSTGFGSWSFAKPFAQIPTVSVQVEGVQIWGAATSVSATDVSAVSVLSTVAEVGLVATVRLMAMGRWV
jgi:hypothetical protein